MTAPDIRDSSRSQPLRDSNHPDYVTVTSLKHRANRPVANPAATRRRDPSGHAGRNWLSARRLVGQPQSIEAELTCPVKPSDASVPAVPGAGLIVIEPERGIGHLKGLLAAESRQALSSSPPAIASAVLVTRAVDPGGELVRPAQTQAVPQGTARRCRHALLLEQRPDPPLDLPRFKAC
jgi:hypothetical protein